MPALLTKCAANRWGDYSAGLQSGAPDGMSVPLYIHLAGSQGRQDDSESAALLSGWMMDSYASEK